VFQTTLTSWAFVWDPLMAWMFWQLTSDWPQTLQYVSRALCFAWLFLLCRIIKYTDHFTRYPQDLKYLLLIPLFGYFHSSVVKACGMVSMHVVSPAVPLVSGIVTPH
jgi:hypothetical protein